MGWNCFHPIFGSYTEREAPRMNVIRITDHKKEYLQLLLLADEEESMVDRYLESGDMFVFTENGEVIGECVVVADETGCELKNLAVTPAFQRMGYGVRIVEFICEHYAGRYRELIVGTGEAPATMGFYRKCGFTEYAKIPGFFTENYGHEIIEDGVMLRDMILLKKSLKEKGGI